MKTLFLVITLCFISNSASADIMTDFGFAYSADTLNTSASSGNTEYFYNLDILFALDHNRRFNVGWSFYDISQTSTASGTSTTYSSFDMGPAFRWQMDKSGTYSATLGYGYLAKGSYNSGSTSETWSGTSLFAQFAAQAPLGDKFYIGLSLNYYSASYSQKTVSSVESSNSATKSWIFPMLSMTWRP